MKNIIIFNFSLLEILVNFVFYIVAAILLNMFYKNEYGKSTVLAFIPMLHFYIIGKLLKGKGLGILFVILGIITINVRFVFYINGVKNWIGLGTIFWSILLILIIVLLIKYLKKKKKENINKLN